jgi:hypothetical protein
MKVLGEVGASATAIELWYEMYAEWELYGIIFFNFSSFRFHSPCRELPSIASQFIGTLY